MMIKATFTRTAGAAAMLVMVLVTLAIFWPAREAQSVTRGDHWVAKEVNAAWYGNLQLTGLTYDAPRERFYAVVADDDPGLRMVTLSTEFDLLHTWRIPNTTLEAPTPLYNEAVDLIYLLDSAGDCCALYVLAPEQTTLQPAGTLSLNAPPLALAFDSEGTLHLISTNDFEQETLSVSRFQPDAAGDTNILLSAAEDALTLSDSAPSAAHLPQADLVVVNGLRLHIADGSGFVASDTVLQLGRQLPDDHAPLNAVVAPSLDSTDDPATTSLYAVGPQGVFEIMYQPASTITALTDVSVPAATAVNTWQWDPSSPDPAGITYLPASGQLLISDSEVNEIDPYPGANLFLTNLNGVLEATDDTTSFPDADEPTGITVNPANHHIFISNDDDRLYHELTALPATGTIERTVNTAPGGNGDPEGIAFDPDTQHIFVVDGNDSEVYRYNPAGNLVSSFDVGDMGISDPEGIAHDDLSGHLLVLDSTDGQIVEVTTDGEFVREIELLSDDLDKPAGLVYGPAAGNPTTRTLYVVDRQLDNDNNPEENDGIMFIFEVPVDEHTPTPTAEIPTTTFTPTLTNTVAPPTNTPPSPTNTVVAPTNTPPSPTNTVVAPTNTPATPTGTPVTPPTATPTSLTPTATPVTIPTDTPTTTPPPPSPTATPGASPQPTATSRPGADHQLHFPILAFEQLGQFGEENDICPAAYPLLTNRTYQFLAEDRDDWYRFSTIEEAVITVHLSDFAPQAGQIAVYRGDTCGSSTFIRNDGSRAREKTVELGLQAPGIFYIYVSNDGSLNSQALYSLIVQTR